MITQTREEDEEEVAKQTEQPTSNQPLEPVLTNPSSSSPRPPFLNNASQHSVFIH